MTDGGCTTRPRDHLFPLKHISAKEPAEDFDPGLLLHWGLLLIAFAVVGSAAGTYALIVSSPPCPKISKWIGLTGNRVLDDVRNDWYYCLLLPMSIPVCIFFVYLNWVSLKFFKHA
ncbi:hypothetical protein CYMTET_18846 [Cymbomonas tetramitiformis]|uniref:Uncharacterized protein n=1 Tax=Cymbomonas tetramitiformis TaxID=36881 RepID=A0AAE0G7S2_9CHLO|nr:hypothetical protein CYMTET_18846 [Cymbomonas tetramitiformis]